MNWWSLLHFIVCYPDKSTKNELSTNLKIDLHLTTEETYNIMGRGITQYNNVTNYFHGYYIILPK